MAVDGCAHCDHYRDVTRQLYETAIALDDTEGRLHTVQARVRDVAEALVWCLARIDDPPAWIRQALEDAEAAV